jgi:cobalamin biosynthesis protein CbiD
VQWGKSKNNGATSGTVASSAAAAAVASVGAGDAAETEIDPDAIPIVEPPTDTSSIYYASTDPTLLGSSAKTYRA